ncbi:hypothetical protein MUK60_27735 [Streptomyces sp. LRE541]|uniref:hypothetical protein n=1 Tax=Streptomyces sp. LRE541 TaxID=2931983 RepID=UPI00200D34BB|nr:hypothetical protein [Streptomyces sp. LRE541]UPZ31230.1 hypothetical protein MUK60_27735 [Streptomyces sp. LRE541]
MPEYEGAEHEEAGHEEAGHEETGYEGIDALLAAITDEPLPEGARHDTAFMAEHRSAVADVALLREQLRIMGDTLAGEAPAGQASPLGRPPVGRRLEQPRVSAPRRPPKEARPRQPRRYRRHAGAAMGTLVVVAGTALLGGLVWLGARGGADSTGSADSSAAKQEDSGGDSSAYSPEMHLACSKVLVEGTVRSITPTGDGTVRVVLEAKRYYRPEQSATAHPTITVMLLDSARKDLKVGTYTLVRLPVDPRDRQDWETGQGVGDARKEILDALPGARGMECAKGEGGTR